MSLAALAPYVALLEGSSFPWCFGGGWAIDGLVGRATRPHDDVDVLIWRDDQQALRAQFAAWDWQTYVERVARPWPADEVLALPAHNALGRHGAQELEVLLLERAGDDWWFRRNPAVRMAAARVMVPTAQGFAVLNPAIALLFKSNRLAEKDRADFTVVLPHLTPADRAWLKAALAVMGVAEEWRGRL